MQLLPNGKQTFSTAAGQPLANGKVYFYQPGTSTLATTYQDSAGQTPNANPVVLDGNGQAIIYGSGSYRQVVQDANGVTIWDQVTTAPDAGFVDLANTVNGKGADLVANAAKKVASIAALKALRVPQGSDAQTVIVDGYASANDGGNGRIIWSATATAADDGGTVFKPNSLTADQQGRWLRLFTGAWYASWFNVRGDGVTDDTVAVKAFFTALAAAKPAGLDPTNAREAIFPMGTVLLSDTVIPPRAYSNEGFFKIRGDGYLGTTLKWIGPVDRIMIDATNQPYLNFQNFKIDGGAAAGKPAYGLAAWGVSPQHPSHQRVEDIYAINCKVGVAFSQGQPYHDSSGTLVAAGASSYGTQDSIYRNTFIESCDYGFLAGHTNNKYENFRVTCGIGTEIYTGSFGTFDNCYWGGSNEHIRIIDLYNGGAVNLQNFNNCWWESGTANSAVFQVRKGTVAFSASVNVTNCNIADSLYLVDTDSNITVQVNGQVNFGSGGTSTTNKTATQAGATTTINVNSSQDYTFTEVGAGVLNVIGAWQQPAAFTNSWANFNSTYQYPRYRIDAHGNVDLQGHIANGTIGAAAFTLPAAYRPPMAMIFPAVSQDAFGELRVMADGTVIPQTGAVGWFSINCRFRVS